MSMLVPQANGAQSSGDLPSQFSGRLDSMEESRDTINTRRLILQVRILNMGGHVASSYIYSSEHSITLNYVLPAIIRNHSDVLELYSPLRIDTDLSMDLDQEIRVREDHVFMLSPIATPCLFVRLRTVDPSKCVYNIPRKAYLMNFRLAFVNRGLCVSQLLINHHLTKSRRDGQSKWNTKRCAGPGSDWKYPICLNDYGSGKSSFADNYLLILKDFPTLVAQYPILERYSGIASELQGAIYIRVDLDKVQPCVSGSSERCSVTAIGSYIQERIRDQISTLVYNAGILEQVEFRASLPDFIQHLFTFLDKPIFLVFDEVGAPFNDGSMWSNPSNGSKGVQKIRFNNFIEEIVQPLLMQPKLFILLCGRAPFLDWVGANPEGKIKSSGSRVRAERIVLNMIRPEYIVRILKETIVDKDVTVESFLGLEDVCYVGGQLLPRQIRCLIRSSSVSSLRRIRNARLSAFIEPRADPTLTCN